MRRVVEGPENLWDPGTVLKGLKNKQGRNSPLKRPQQFSLDVMCSLLFEQQELTHSCVKGGGSGTRGTEGLSGRRGSCTGSSPGGQPT